MALWADTDKGIRIDFGKFRGKYLHQIPSDYLRWMIKEHVDRDAFDGDLIRECEKEIEDRGEDAPWRGD